MSRPRASLAVAVLTALVVSVLTVLAPARLTVSSPATSPATTTAGTTAVAAAQERTARPPTYGGRVRIDGEVRRPIFLRVADLERRYEQRTLTTTFSAQGQPTTRTFTGPLLLDVLTDTRPRFDESRSNDQLAFAVRVGATDGYRAVVAWGEIDPGFAGTEMLLATVEDGRRLQRPRLVVPGDARGGRYVTDVLDIRVLDLG